MEPGLKAAESTVVLLEQNKPDQPKKKKTVKETLVALRIIESLGNCLEVALTVSELFVLRHYFRKAYLDAGAASQFTVTEPTKNMLLLPNDTR